MRVPHTFTIDDMPEAERPRRTIFYNRNPVPEPPQPQPQPEARAQSEPANSADPIVTIHHSDWSKFQQIIFEALSPFADARDALAAAFEQFRQQHGGPLYEPA